MQRNSLAFGLLGLAIISGLATVYLCLKTTQAMAENKLANSRVLVLQARAAQAEGLFNEAVQYSKKNPAILTALRNIGFTNFQTGPVTRPNR